MSGGGGAGRAAAGARTGGGVSAAAILLAAGASSRMGESKALLDWGGRPLVAAQVGALAAAGCDPVIVVLGSQAGAVRRALPSGARWTINGAWREGRAGSIRAGARVAPRHVERVVVASVDQPCSASAVRRTLEALAADREARIAVPRHGGRNGHPPVFDAALLPELRRATERGEGLREVRRRWRERTIFVDVEDPAVLLDLNTPEDYRRALAAGLGCSLSGRGG